MSRKNNNRRKNEDNRKDVPMKDKVEKKSKKGFVVLIGLIVIAAFIGIYLIRNSADKSSRAESTRENKLSGLAKKIVASNRNFGLGLDDGYLEIMKKLTDSQISQRFLPAHIFLNENFIASGVVDNESDKPFIYTTKHTFTKLLKGGIYGYQILRPFSVKLYPISTTDSFVYQDRTGTDEKNDDIVICWAGPQKHIEAFASSELSWNVGQNFSIVKPDKWYTSLLCGKRYKLLGLLGPEENSARKMHILLYEPTKGESGSGFVGDDGSLLILSSSCKISDEDRRFFGDLLPKDASVMCAMVNVGVHVTASGVNPEEQIKEHLTDEVISSRFKPALIYVNDQCVGNGVYNEDIGGPAVIASPVIFPRELAKGYVSFQVLRPYNERKTWVDRILELPAVPGSLDKCSAIVLGPGKKTELTGLNRYSIPETQEVELGKLADGGENLQFKSLISGREYNCAGYGPIAAYVMFPYQVNYPYAGEVFISGDSSLLILRNIIDNEQARSLYSVDKDSVLMLGIRLIFK